MCPHTDLKTPAQGISKMNLISNERQPTEAITQESASRAKAIEVVVSLPILPRNKHDILPRLHAHSLNRRRLALAALAPDIDRRDFLRFERV
jgi:hypothetical protein